MQEHDDPDVAGKLFIGGLSWHTSVTTLRNHFEQFGECVDVALMIDKRTGKPRGFAFVKMGHVSDAERILSMVHTIDGRRVDVKRALPRDRAPGPIRSVQFKLFVGGLPPSFLSKELEVYFAQFGPVKEAVVMMDRATGNSRGFGFVTYHTEEAFEYVMSLKGHMVMDKRVEVRRAEARCGHHEPAETRDACPVSVRTSPEHLSHYHAGVCPSTCLPDTRNHQALSVYHGNPLLTPTQDGFNVTSVTDLVGGYGMVDRQFHLPPNTGVLMQPTGFFPVNQDRRNQQMVCPPVSFNSCFRSRENSTAVVVAGKPQPQPQSQQQRCTQCRSSPSEEHSMPGSQYSKY